ncbi:MAG TPA: hypothetical protein VLC52_11335, partial [Anaerolineae bacterium]|nr:hypothetical protein [Anaerolineae bacterium]
FLSYFGSKSTSFQQQGVGVYEAAKPPHTHQLPSPNGDTQKPKKTTARGQPTRQYAQVSAQNRMLLSYHNCGEPSDGVGGFRVRIVELGLRRWKGWNAFCNNSCIYSLYCLPSLPSSHLPSAPNDGIIF